MERSALFEFSMEPGEQKEVALKVKRDDRGLILGVVVDEWGRVVKDAAVKLFEVEKKNSKNAELSPLTHTFTDEFGQFIFGPLCPDKTYAIKIFVNNTCISRDFAEIKEDRDCLRPVRCKKKPCKDEDDQGKDKCDDDDGDDQGEDIDEQFAALDELIKEYKE